MEAGPELDCLMAEKVMKWQRFKEKADLFVVPGDTRLAFTGPTDKQPRTPTFAFRPSTDMNAAWDINECMLNAKKKIWDKYAKELPEDGVFTKDAKTAALLICLAALKAIT